MAGQVPVDCRYVQQRRVLEVALELGSIGGFLGQVELVEQRRFVVAHHLDRSQAAGLGNPCQDAGEPVQQRHVLAHDSFDAGADDLDYHILAAVKGRGVNLRDGGRCQGLGGEADKGLVE